MDKTSVGFEFEFFSKTPIEKLFGTLEAGLNKKLKYFDEGHSDFKVTTDIWKLEKDYSGGSEMYELVTFDNTLSNALTTLTKSLELIKTNGFTSDKCAIQINLSLSEDLMYKVDKLKLALIIDETKIFNDFPNRLNNVYTRSIKTIIPTSKFYEYSDNLNTSDFIVPNSKYYGVNFTKLTKGYLEFRYLGGKDYEIKTSLISEYVNYFITVLKASANGLLSTAEYAIFKNLVKEHNAALLAYRSYKDFKSAYPNITLSANLIKTPVYMESFFESIKDKLFEILTSSSIKSGSINYNSDYSSYEIVDGVFENVYSLNNVVLIRCSGLVGDITQCRIFNSSIDNSHLQACQLYSETSVANSKLNDCYVSSGSTVDNSYLAGGNTIFLGKLTNSIFRAGKISKQSKEVSINSEYISYKFI